MARVPERPNDNSTTLSLSDWITIDNQIMLAAREALRSRMIELSPDGDFSIEPQVYEDRIDLQSS